MTRDDLIAFTDDLAAEYNAAKIPHPVHLSDGNEDQLIAAFRDIAPDDWALGGWRFHYQSLLKGVPADELRAAIRRGESMSLAFPEHRILCSAIVGGILPIALGVALAIKRVGGPERVHCWLGDMTAEGGMAHECMAYARNHRLPIRWIIEDNSVSVCTDTRAAWGGVTDWSALPDVLFYRYKSRYPHAGSGKRIEF